MRGTLPLSLPAPAASKLTELQLACDAALDAGHAAAGRLSGLPPDADPRMRTRLAGERDKHQNRQRALAGLLSKLNQWAMENRHATLEMVPAVSVDLKGETVSDAVEKVRGEISATKQQLVTVRSAPLPLDAQRALIERAVMERAESRRPSVSIVDDEARISWRENTSMISVLAWLLPQQLTEKLLVGLVELPNAMPADQRKQRLAELEAELLEAERRECALIQRASENGTEILHRVDANPLAVLNVAPANYSRAVERSAA